MATVPVPHDVEAGLIQWLYSHGVDAAGEVPLERVAGMVRLQRVGGPVEDSVDRPEVAVEVWGANASESWDLALRIYALFEAGEGLHQLPGGMTVNAAGVDPPTTYPDEYAPDLHRRLVSVSLICPLDSMEI